MFAKEKGDNWPQSRIDEYRARVAQLKIVAGKYSKSKDEVGQEMAGISSCLAKHGKANNLFYNGEV